MKDAPSQERLNALVDGELTPADAEGLLEQLRCDAALRERVGELRLAKDMVRHAYAEIAPSAPLETRRAGRRSVHHAALAAATLACGVLLGWHVRGPGLPPADASMPLAGRSAAVPSGATDRIVLHASSASPQVGLAVLDRAEGIFESARSAGRTVNVEIVANGGGLDLLRAGVSVHAERIARLRAAHPGLTLVACGQTAQRLRDGGIEVQLLPGTTAAASALDQIVLRMQQGWTYLRT